MKKIFTLIGMALMAMSANAIDAGTYSFVNLSTDKVTITNTDLVTLDETPASGCIASYTYDATGKSSDFAGISVSGISLTIKNSGKKANHFRIRTSDTYVNGGFTLTIPSVTANQIVTINAATDKENPAITVSEGGTADSSNPTMGSTAQDFKFTATGGDLVLTINVATKLYSVTVGEQSGGSGSGSGSSDATAGKIYWTSAIATADMPETFTDGGITLNRVDAASSKKHSVDGNNAWFGDNTTQTKYGFRLKTGGKSSSTNSLSLTIAAAGTLEICARAGGTSDERTLILKQNGSELYNKVVSENDAISVDVEAAITDTNPTGNVKVYPIIKVSVEAGTVDITYPINSINFYAFEYTPSSTDGISTIKAGAAAQDGTIYNLAGQKVDENYKGVVIKNGKKMIQK